MQRRSHKGRLALAVLAAAIAAGCATDRGRAPVPLESELLAGYPAYFSADVAGNRELLEFVLTELEIDQRALLSRTDRVTGGVRFAPGARTDLFAIAAGNFPQGLVRLGLDLDRTVTRTSVEIDGRRHTYHVDESGRVQLAVPRSGALYVATTGIERLLSDRPAAELEIDAETFAALVRVGEPDQPKASIVLRDPGAGWLSSLGIDAPILPLTGLVFSVSDRRTEGSGRTTEESGDDLALAGELTFRNERDAALFGRIGRLFVIILVRSLGLDARTAQEETQISVDANRVVFSGIPMTRAELVSVIRTLVRQP